MSNVLLTNRCVRSCPYCFATKYMAGSDLGACLSWEDLIYIADLHIRSGERTVSLLGGEPTLHPEFVDFVVYLLHRGFTVRIFTSGILQDNLLTELDGILRSVPLERVSFICNLNDPDLSPKAEVSRVQEFINQFGPRTVPGFNIYRAEFDLGFLLHWINVYGLQRSLRLGIAHPIVGHENKFVVPAEMRRVAARLISNLTNLERLKVRVGLDCGFPLCVFTDEEIGKLYRAGGGELRFGCCPAIDIGADMTVWACFPLSSFHKRSLYEFDSLEQVRAYYGGRFRDARIEVGGIYEECDHCAHRKSGLCSGGCLAHGLNHLQHEPALRALSKPH